jgi:anti-sigma regulatory factor (Ser/Thr protein kinase)
MTVRHDLFVYDDDAALVANVAPFLEEGLAGGEPAVVILDRRKRRLLAGAVGADGAMISYIDRDAFYTRPEEVLARYDLKLRQLVRDGATQVRAFAELPRCQTENECNAWIMYEAIVNRALAHHPFWVTCGYDRREMPESLLKAGLETHPDVMNGGCESNLHYRTPETVVTSRTPRPAVLENLRALPAAGDPGLFRQTLGAELNAAEVPECEGRDMIVAAGEVLANAQQHGGSQVSVRVGRVNGHFVCEVLDDGSGMDDPLAGFVPPRPGTGDGSGLWVARQLTRRLDLVPTPEGFAVRLWAGAGKD